MRVSIVLEQWHTGSPSDEFEANSHVVQVSDKKELADAYVEGRLKDGKAAGENLSNAAYGFQVEEHEVTV